MRLVAQLARANLKKIVHVCGLNGKLKKDNDCVIGSSPIQPPMCCVAQW